VNRPALTIRAIPVPREGAERSFHAAIDILAEALAQQIIADARAEVAARLGVAPDAIDREHGGLQDELRVEADPTRRGAR
jgi:hypothetical protein